jgi:HEAT repeats
MMIQRFLLVCLLLTALPLQALGLATEHHGNAPIGPGWNFPADVVRVANLPSRVYWREINGDPMFFFRGNTAALNQALEAFAQIQGEKEILLVPAPSDVRTLVERKPVPCDWELHAPNGFYVHFARQEKGTQVMTKHPRLTIYVTFAGTAPSVDAKQVTQWIAELNSEQFTVRDNANKELEKLGRAAASLLRKAKEGRPSPEQLRRIDALLDKLVGIDLDQIRFPAGVKIVSPRELRSRYVEGLKSDSGDIRGHALGGLGEQARFTDQVIPILVDALKNDKHEYVRRSAASALARLGKRSTAALPTLKAGLNDPDVNIRNSFETAIDWIEHPKDEQPTKEQLRERETLAREIDQFCEKEQKQAKK